MGEPLRTGRLWAAAACVGAAAILSVPACAQSGSSSSTGGSDASATLGTSSGSTSSGSGSGHTGLGSNEAGTDASMGSGSGAASSGSGAASASSTDAANGGSGGSAGSGDAGSTGGPADGASGPAGTAAASLVFSPYKDTSINLNWNTNVISTNVSGTATPLGMDLVQHGGKTITLAFATGECGSENWAGVGGAAMATANGSLLVQAGVEYILSTGGAAGTFTCGSDSGFATFVNRWASSNLIGVDFDIEGGQTTSVTTALIQRIQAAHATYPKLRFSLTLATLATSAQGATTAQSLGANAQDSLNTLGDQVMAAVKATLGFSGSAATWPAYLTVDLMTMDYGSAGAGNCVVSGSTCDMGQSALQAAYNLHDRWGVPYSNIELTPMLGTNDVSSEQFTLSNVDTVAAFAIANGLAGVHYWSYDRDTDCAAGSASPTCNSMGAGYAGAYGYLSRLLHHGLH